MDKMDDTSREKVTAYMADIGCYLDLRVNEVDDASTGGAGGAVPLLADALRTPIPRERKAAAAGGSASGGGGKPCREGTETGRAHPPLQYGHRARYRHQLTLPAGDALCSSGIFPQQAGVACETFMCLR